MIAVPARKIAMKRPEPSAATVDKMTRYVSKYWVKSGPVGHPDADVPKAVVLGLAANLEECGRGSLSVQLLSRQGSRAPRPRPSLDLRVRRDEEVEVLPLPPLRDARGDADHRVPSRGSRG